ncbi:multidrug transporter, partial [Burkholderia thailandensis]|nr:multidrug transporter [Burkholderia thailandensis]
MMKPLARQGGPHGSRRPGGLRAWPAALAAALVTGCTLAPRYERPAAPVPANYLPAAAGAPR